MSRTFPFTAIVGQEKLKKALLLVAVDPTITGVLIKGPKGVAKSTAVRALASLLPEIEVVADCPFSCDPHRKDKMCSRCRSRVETKEILPLTKRKKRIVELPVSATLDRVVGTLDIKRVLKEGDRGLEPGLLAQANRGILYIDEVNLLPDDVVNAILDSAASKVNIVEREGISVMHPADFILIGTMNPEEGELRPQLLDRFAISVEAESPSTPEELIEITKRVEEFERDPDGFLKKFEEKEADLRAKVLNAIEILPKVKISDHHLDTLARTILSLSVSTRAMIAATKVSKALAALDGRDQVTDEDVEEALELVLGHRKTDRSVSTQTTRKTTSEERYQGNLGEAGGGSKSNEEKSRDTKNEEIQLTKIDLPKTKNEGTSFGKGGIFDHVTGKSQDGGFRLDLHLSLINMALNRRSWLEPEDLSFKKIKNQGAVPILLLLDASKSMDFSRRIVLAKSILNGLIVRAYQVRSKVGLISFSGTEAKYVVPFTRNLKKVSEYIEGVTAQGKTPMSMALSLAIRVTNRERRSRRSVSPLIFLISDGKANVSLGGNVTQELSELSEKLGKISKLTVVDTGSPFHPSFNSLISERSGGVLIHVKEFSWDLHK